MPITICHWFYVGSLYASDIAWRALCYRSEWMDLYANVGARTLCSPSLIYFEVYNNQPWWQLKYNNIHWIGEELVHYMWWYIRDQEYLIWFDMVLTKDFIDQEWKMILLFKQPINYYSIEVHNNQQWWVAIKEYNNMCTLGCKTLMFGRWWVYLFLREERDIKQYKRDEWYEKERNKIYMQMVWNGKGEGEGEYRGNWEVLIIVNELNLTTISHNVSSPMIVMLY